MGFGNDEGMSSTIKNGNLGVFQAWMAFCIEAGSRFFLSITDLAWWRMIFLRSRMILFVSSPKSWTQTLYAHLPLFLSSGSPSRLNSGLYACSWRSVEKGDGRNCAGSLDGFPNAEKNLLRRKAFELGGYRGSKCASWNMESALRGTR
jgi:hypothetical protein